MADELSPQRDPGPRIDALEGRVNSADEYLRGMLSNDVAAVRGMTGVLDLGIQSLRAELRGFRAAQAGHAEERGNDLYGEFVYAGC
jgi:hypothetical protein